MAGQYKLTDAMIKRMKAPAKVKKISDGHGLNIVLSPAGGKLWEYRFRYEGKPRVLALGRYPLVTLSEARQKHQAARKLLADGIDPAAEKKARKQAAQVAGMTFGDAAMGFIQSRRELGFNGRALDDIWGRLEKHILPSLKNRALSDIKAPEILETLLTIKRQGIEETAKRCRQYVSMIFQNAIVRGQADRNPAEDLRGIAELRRTKPVQHMRAVKTPSALGRLLVDIEGVSSTMAGKALDLAAYVFLRPSELAGGQWHEVDWGNSLWRVPAERTKMRGEHLVPLARQVKERLEALKQLTGGGIHVFPSRHGSQAPLNSESLRMSLLRLGYGATAVGGGHTGHGFRATASTLLRELGHNSAIIELQLAHAKRNSVEAAYNFAEYMPERRAMMQKWADYLDELREKARAEAGCRT